MTAAITLSRLQKDYGPVHALRGVSLAVPEGEIWGLLGHNGAGKTTLMKLVLGLIRPTSGTVDVLGQAPTGPGMREMRRRIGYLPEVVAFYGELTGGEVLDYFARLKGAGAEQSKRLLEQLELSEVAQRPVKTYSKGMKQRLGLAQALLGRPSLLLLDEPTVGLDPIAANQVYRMLRELSADGVTVLLSSHVLPGIERHVDRVAILGYGRLLAAGTIEELRAASQLPVTIRVRGRCDDVGILGTLSEDPRIGLRNVNGNEFEIRGPQAMKLPILRTLMGIGSVEDVLVVLPSLDTIYAYFAEKGGCAEGARP